MMSSVVRWHSSDVSPHDESPWPPSTMPFTPGRYARSIIIASSNPGRCHGIHATSSPKHSRVSRSPSLRCREGDDRVRVHVIDVRRRDERVGCRVDGGRRRLRPEAAVMLQQREHLVLVLDAPVLRLRGEDAVEIQHRQPVARQRPEIAAAPFDIEKP